LYIQSNKIKLLKKNSDQRKVIHAEENKTTLLWAIFEENKTSQIIQSNDIIDRQVDRRKTPLRCHFRCMKFKYAEQIISFTLNKGSSLQTFQSTKYR
jgi:hypothetical protein